jgi:drug/metabolite transporter (DMT)-like permease
MNNKIIGIVLIVVGVALALWGYDVFDSASSQISRALSGDTPIEAWLGMVGGVICAAVGISKIR